MYLLCGATMLLIIILIMIKLNENANSKEGFTGFAGINSNSDTPWTIEKTTKLVVTDILRKIVNEINNKTGMSYIFTAYDQLGQEKLSTIKTLFTADFFVHEMRNLESRRIIIKFIVNFSTKKVNVEYINLSNAFKLPEKQFMDYTSPELILQDDNLLNNKYHIMGLNSSKIEFSILRDDEGRPKQVPTPTEFNKWILPLGIDASVTGNPQKMFQHKSQSKCWGTDGSNFGNKIINSEYPYFNPTVNLQKTWNTEYKWLNDLTDNSSGVSGSVAFSP